MSVEPTNVSITDPKKLAELMLGTVGSDVLLQAKDAMANVTLANHQLGNTNASATYGGTGVYYGPNDRAVTAAAAKYENLVVEPGNYTKAPQNGIAYVPLSGLNKDNQHHQKLFQDVMKAGGFLQDVRGNYIEDPQGPGTYMIDWRKPAVQGVMAGHLKNLMRQGYDGVMFDAIDSVVGVENGDAELFGKQSGKSGLTKSALEFAYNAKVFIKKAKPDAQIIINGGIASQYAGNDELDVKKVLGMTADQIMVESQYSVGGQPRNNEGDRAWLVGQLSEVATHAKKEFGFAIVDPGWAPMNLQQATQVGQNALKFTKGVAEEVSQQVNAAREDNNKVHINGSVICTNDYTTAGMCAGNAVVAEKVNQASAGDNSRSR